MKTARFMVLLTLLGGSPLTARATPPPTTEASPGETAITEAGVTVRQLSGARVIEAVLPGRVVSTSASSGAGSVAVLVAGTSSKKPRAIYRLSPTSEGALELLVDGLPSKVNALGQLPLHGNGQRHLIVGEPGRLYSLGPIDDPATHRKPRLLLETSNLDFAMLKRRRLTRSDSALLPQPSLGRLEIFRGNAEGDLELIQQLALPVRAERRDHGLRLSTRSPHLLARPEAPLPLIALGPTRHGQRRLQTTLIDPLAATDPENTEVETWSQLGANEKVAQSWYRTVDGRPILIVATLNADKIGIFEKKKLRVFPLRTDRTRVGTPPSLEIQTVTRNWYDIGIVLADCDLDGLEDLVVLQPDGLGAKKLAVEVYRGKGNSGFFATPKRSVILARNARWAFGSDLGGDRAPDLVAIDSDQNLSVYSSIPGSKKKVLGKDPTWSLSLDSGGDGSVSVHISIGDDDESDSDRPNDLGRSHQPVVVDLHDDGNPEILLRTDNEVQSILRIVELAR